MCWAPVSQQNFSCNVTYLFFVLVGFFFYPVDVVVGFSLGAPESWTPPLPKIQFFTARSSARRALPVAPCTGGNFISGGRRNECINSFLCVHTVIFHLFSSF